MILSLIVCAGSMLFINVTQDDPFISFRYAENLANGYGLVFNRGERLEGFSNPSWTLLFSVIALIVPKFTPLYLMWIAKALGILLTLWSVMLLHTAERRIYPGRFPFASVLLALNPCVWVWAVGALETSLCAFLLSVVIFDEAVRGGTYKGPIAMGILAVTRPETPAILLAYIFWRWWVRRVAPWKDSIALFYLVVPVCWWFIFRVLFYGDVLPNTFYAKTPYKDWLFSFRYLLDSVKQFSSWWFLSPLFILGLMKPSREIRKFPQLILLVYLPIIFLAGGDWMPGARFFVHIAPAIGWVMADGYRHVVTRFKLNESWFFVFILPFILLGNFWIIDVAMKEKDYRVAPWPWQRLSEVSPVYPHYYKMAEYIVENVDDDAVIATGEAGLIPYLTGVRIIDCLGLVNYHIARLSGPSHVKFDKWYVLLKDPDYIIMIGYVTDHRLYTYFEYCRELWGTRLFHERYELEYRVDDLMLYRRVPNPEDSLSLDHDDEYIDLSLFR